MSLLAPDRAPAAGRPAPPPAEPASGRRRWWSGRAGDPSWARPALLGLLLGTAVLYLWGLSANGYGNEFYAMAAQSGSLSWKAWFFGSLDAGNTITVDKTPASLWVMGLSVRLFGLSSWSLLVPEALMGVGTVALVVAAVRRTVGRPGPALLAGAAMALTPVAALMFRFDNPDALLVLLLTAAGHAVVRALEGPRAARWLALAGALVGSAFLAKMLQAFLVLPAFALAYLVLGPGGVGRRLLHLVGAGVALVVAGGWWVAIVQAWPAASRPWIGGSTADSVLELALGYNGLSRLSGSEAGPRSGTPGWLRLLGADLGGQIAWLLPAALVALVFGLVVTARAPRTDRVRGALVVWGGWLLVTGATFSLMAGTFHSYYAVALAPAVAVLVGIGAGLLWPVRHTLTGAAGLGLGVLATTATSFELLSRATDFLPWLRWVVLGGGMLASIAVAVSGSLGSGLRRTAAGLAVAVALAGPASYTVDTVTTAHSGSMPTAGPASAGATGGFGGGGAPGGMPGGMSGGFPGGSSGTAPTGTAPTGTFRSGGPGGFGGGQVSSALLTLLEDDAGTYTWVAATTGSQAAAPYQLATGSAVMAIGGFTGSDDAPTLARFQADVAAGEIHYYISGGGMGGRGGSSSASQIASWVAAHFTATTVGGVAVYDLTAPTS